MSNVSLMTFPDPNDDGAANMPHFDVQELVRQFNEDEAVWRYFARRRALRKLLRDLTQLLDLDAPLTEEELDQLDWLAAEREARPMRTIGKVWSH